MAKVSIGLTLQHSRVECTTDEYFPETKGVVVVRGRFTTLYPWHVVNIVEIEREDEDVTYP